MKHVLLLALLALAGCTAPTLQQRQDNWHKYQRLTRGTCALGLADPAMPDDVRPWCQRVAAP